MEIVERGEVFEEVDGQFTCSGTLVVYESDGHLYHAHSKSRYPDLAEIKMEELRDRINMPIDAYSPLLESTLTVLDPPPVDCYIKRPRLISYDRVRNSACPAQVSDDLLAEAKTCEILKHHLHPNLARYLGCQVRNGRITGLCFARYKQTLMERANRRNHMKRSYTGSGWASNDCNRYMDDIERGVRHLHSLGLVHNDINPANIMFDDEGRPVIIDFGSCRPIGQSLEG